MQGCCRQLVQLTFGLITQPAARRLSGYGGRKISQLTWSHDPKNRRQIVRHFCTTEDHSVISYQQLRDLLESKAIWLIDVREKWEIAEHGKIPGSISIPLGQVMEALQMDSVYFKEKYNQDIPSKSDHVVFSCLAGVRSKQAVAVAKSLGFSRVQHYPGGFNEWLEYECSKKK